jgi:hypothetical protein
VGPWRYEGEPRVVVNCHCRKATGSAVATWAWSRSISSAGCGREQLREFASCDHARRSFCERCGSTMGNLTTRWPKLMHLAAGTLDRAPALKVALHVRRLQGSLAGETDALPQHDNEPAPPR